MYVPDSDHVTLHQRQYPAVVERSDTGLLGADAVMVHADGVADLIEQPELIFLPGVHHASIILEENYLWYDYQWHINILDAKES